MDDGAGGRRVSSAAFSDKEGSLSVALSVLLERHNKEPKDVVARFPGYGLYELNAGFIRSLGLGIVPDPTDEEPWHGAVHGKKTKAIKVKLATGGALVVRPIVE